MIKKYTPAKILKELVEIKQFINIILQNDELPSETIEKIFKIIDDPYTQSHIAGHRNTAPQTLTKMVAGRAVDIKLAVLRNKNTTQDTRARLTQDKDVQAQLEKEQAIDQDWAERHHKKA